MSGGGDWEHGAGGWRMGRDGEGGGGVYMRVCVAACGACMCVSHGYRDNIFLGIELPTTAMPPCATSLRN